MQLEYKILKAIQKVSNKQKLQLHEPFFFGKEKSTLSIVLILLLCHLKESMLKKFEVSSKYINAKYNITK